MKTLILARHAKSDWPVGVPDIKRPLKKRGENDAAFLGKLLASQSFSPDMIISSPANRALSTAKIIARTLSFTEEIQVEDDIYYQGAAHLIQRVREFPPSWNAAMVFGHNPTMEIAVQTLLGQDAEFLMPTSAMACIEIASDSWKHLETDHVHLRWFLIPRLKRKG